MRENGLCGSNVGYVNTKMLWSKIINLLSVPSSNESQLALFGLNEPTKPFVKMIEDPRILTCQEVEDIEAYYQMEKFEQEVSWILTGMKPDDYENPLYDILEEDETSDSEIDYAEHILDYDY